MRSAIVISVVAILVVASLGVGYLAGSAGQHTETLTSTSTLMSQQAFTYTLTSQKTTTAIITQHGTAQWQVLKSNITVYYGTACMVVYAVNFGCPTINTATHSPSVGNVQLVGYVGNQYYVGQVGVNDVLYTIWFTNSTIFCVSPLSDTGANYLACP